MINNAESCRRNHNLCLVITNSVDPFYISKSFSGTISLTYKEQTITLYHFYKTTAHMFTVTKTLQ